MKKSIIFILVVILIVMVVGCGTVTDSPKQTILNSVEKNKEIGSMTYSGNIELTSDVKDVLADTGNNQLMQMIDNCKIVFDGKQKLEPFYMEVDMSILTNIQGMDLTFDIPLIADEDNLYITIPSMMKMYLPELDKNYLMMDISERNKNDNGEGYKEDSIKIFNKIVDAVGEDDFLRQDANSYNIENGKVKDVITFNINKDNLKTYMENFINNDGLTEMISYLDKYSVSEDLIDKLQQIKFDVGNDSEKINQAVNKMNEKVVINNYEVTTVFDKDDFLRKIIFNIDVNKVDEDVNFIITGQFDINTINKGIQIEKQIPSQEEVTSMNNLDLFNFMNK